MSGKEYADSPELASRVPRGTRKLIASRSALGAMRRLEDQITPDQARQWSDPDGPDAPDDVARTVSDYCAAAGIDPSQLDVRSFPRLGAALGLLDVDEAAAQLDRNDTRGKADAYLSEARRRAVERETARLAGKRGA